MAVMDSELLGMKAGSPQGQAHASPALGVHHVVFFVVAAAAPLGFAVGSVPWAVGRGGIGTACMFLIVGGLIAIFAAGFTSMSRFVPNAGAFFSYITLGLGRPLGLGTAVVATFGYALATIGSFGTFGVFASQATSLLTGLETSWQVWASVALVISGILGVLNVDLNLRALGTMLVTELAVLTVLSVCIIVAGGAQGLSLAALQPKSLDLHDVGVAFLIVFAAFTGFEATVLFREEVRNPKVTIRRATYISIVLIALLQAFVCWSIIQAFGDQAVGVARDNPTQMYALASIKYAGPAFARILAVLVAISWLASLIAFHNITARYLFLLARDRAIPGVFAKRSKKTAAPWVASSATTALSGICVWMCSILKLDPYADFFVLSSVPVALAVPSMECLTALSILIFFWKDRRGESVFATRMSPVVSAVVLSIVVYLSLKNMPFYTGRDGPLNWILPSTDLAFLLIGVARALWLRRNDSARYRNLGHWGERPSP